MDYPRFLARIQDRTGIATPDQAGLAVSASLIAIARTLDADTREQVAEVLPSPLADMVRRAPPGGRGSPLADIAEREHVSLGAAHEHVQVVCQTLAEFLDARARRTLAELLDPELAAWLEPHVAASAVDIRPRPRVERGASLADGRPGSTHPLSEARPPRGHTDSPALTPDPDAQTRLSSTHGVSTEREGQTLATGRPGSRHPIVGSGE